MKLLIIVPAYNEAQVIAKTLKRIKSVTDSIPNREIIVVDDGSTDETADIVRSLGITVLRHVINRGLGGAIGTGLAFAKTNGYDIALTIDADGQHDPHDIRKVILPLQKDLADVVIGTRTHVQNQQMPIDRRFLIWASNVLTQILFGQMTSDSQSGFRAFNKTAIQKIIIKTERMEVSSELFSEIKRLSLRLYEIPIKVIYTPYSKSKGQSNSNALNIIYKLFLRLFR